MRKRMVRYISPIMSSGGYQWIIVVHAGMQYRLERPRVEPMWRKAAPQDVVGLGSFPDQWHDMRSWPNYEPDAPETLGLPNALRKHYQRHRVQIEAFCRPRTYERLMIRALRAVRACAAEAKALRDIALCAVQLLRAREARVQRPLVGAVIIG